MFSIRALSRAVPKTPFRPITTRHISSIPRPSALRPSWTAVSRPTAFRSFTSSPYRWEPAGQVDTELSAKLEQELLLEKQSKDSDQIPPELQEFLENSGFEIQETPGSEEVVLTKQFGDEHIKVSFSVADLDAIEEDPDDFQDPALEDEDFDDDLDPQSTGPRSKGTVNAGRTPDGNFNVAPEDRVAPADRPELADNEAAAYDDDMSRSDAQAGFDVHLNVTITKANGGGALQLLTVVSDGIISIDEVHYFPSDELADPRTPAKHFERQDLYAGPPFANLDEELQLLFERYLEERGVNMELAQFIPDYIDYKEQKEYVGWLDRVKGFINA